MSSILTVGNIQSTSAQAASYTAIDATGGNITNDITVNGVQYRVHIFTANGRFSVNSVGTSSQVEYLIVAGGGGGGMDMGGGGGGGGVLTGTTTVARGDYPVVVGAGGQGAPGGGQWPVPRSSAQPTQHQFTQPAYNGGNSSIFSLTAVGGGAGGSSYYQYTPGATGNSGGSGGGASGYSDGGTRAGGSGTSGQGYAGGQGGGQYYSGGGGGAGGPGINSTFVSDGGPGKFSDILGNVYYWGGGGGGSGYSINGGNGGIGGGGGGAVGTTAGGLGYNNGNAGGGGSTNSQTNTPGGNGGTNTGGGGGGGSHYFANNQGGTGGSGIVVVRYPITAQEQKIPVLNNGVVAVAGTIIQVKYVRTDNRTTYSVGPDNGTSIGELGLTITPKSASSLILLRWMVNGEGHWDTSWRVLQDNNLITEGGYAAFNQQAGAVPWSGIATPRYDRGDNNSTMWNQCLQYFVPAYTTQTRTYTPALRYADTGSSTTFYLNRTVGALGQDGHENAVSAGYAMEIAQ